MSNKLKIYACSGIGDVTTHSDKPLSYWSDGTNSISNTQAVNTLLAIINSRNIAVQRLRSITPEKKIEYLNDIDMLSIALYAAKRYKSDPEELHRAGMVISYMLQEGEFDYNSLAGREDHLDTLYAKFEDIMGDNMDIQPTAAFMEWWKATVEDRNKTGFNFGVQQKIRKAMKKDGETGTYEDNKDLARYLNDGGTYFLYTYFTQAQLNQLPNYFSQKKRTQQRTYDYCKSLYVGLYGSEDDMREVIRLSIVNPFEEEPEKVCADIVAGRRKVKGIGFCWEPIVAAIITTVLSAIFGLIANAISAKAQSQSDRYAAIDIEAAQAASPNPEDFETANLAPSTSSVLPLAAAGVALYLLLK